MEAILRAMTDRAEYEQKRARSHGERGTVQPPVRACHILAVARYGEATMQGERVTAHRYQIAIIKEPRYPAEVDVRDEGVPDPRADEGIVQRGEPPMKCSEDWKAGPHDARTRAVAVGVRCVQGHTRTVNTQDPNARRDQLERSDESPLSALGCSWTA